jgi:hypothetical protein
MDEIEQSLCITDDESLEENPTEILRKKDKMKKNETLTTDNGAELSKKNDKKTLPKRERSEKQKLAFLKMKEVQKEHLELKRNLKEDEKIRIQKEKEDLIVKKAKAILKKQLREKAILEDISDDETPPEKLKILKEKIEKKKKVLEKRECPAKETPISTPQQLPAPPTPFKIVFL